MATTRLTPRGIAALETDRPQMDVWDDLLPGFGVRVSGTTGAKTYFVRYRANGRQRRMKVGRHPTLTLAKARDRARELLAEAQAGEDPQADRTELRSADVTFAALAEEVLEAKAATTREATRSERRRIVDVELLPSWGAVPAASISRRDVVQLVEAIARRGAPVMANRTLALVRLIFNTGIRRGFPTLETSPAHLVEPPGEESGRDRFLERNELPVLWSALEEEGPVMAGVFRLALLTAQRVGSVCAIRWEDVDDADVWTIPADQFKGRRRHAVPLSVEALEVLDGLRAISGHGSHVFPGRADGADPHITSTNKALQRIRKRTGLRRWTVHDFRTTFRTHATRAAEPANPKDPAGLGVAPHVADAVLGHKEASLGFDRYTAEPERYLLAEKREALTRWGRFVREAVEAE